MSTEMGMGKMNLNTNDSLKKEKNTEHTDNSDSNSNYSSNSDFEASVGMTRKWNAREAGREVAENTLKKLKHKPSFFILFSTIHYEKNGGFQEFLNGVWDVLPKGTPLVGGTFAGFANNEGCFTRGATALAVSYSNIKVKIGFGKNIKRSPKKALKNCFKMLGKEKPEYDNVYLFDFIASGTVPKIGGLGRKKVLNVNRILNKFITPLFSILTEIFQFGIGREEEVLEHISKKYPNIKEILGGSTSDDNKWERSYQFFNNKCLENSVVLMVVETDFKSAFSSETGLKSTGIKINPTKVGNFGCSMIKINGKPALKEFSTKLGWSEDLFDEHLHRRTLYYPVGKKDEKGEYLRLLALVVGSTLVFSNRIVEKDLEIYTASGQSLIDAVDSSISKCKLNNIPEEDLLFSFVVSCTARLETLGKNIYAEQEKLKKVCGEKPFIVIYASGEDTIDLSKKWIRRNESFNLCTFKR